MTLLAGSLFTSCGYELSDMVPGEEHMRWPVLELAEYLTEAIAQIAVLRPSLFTSWTPLRLAAGAAQSLPGDYAELIDVLHNLKPDGTAGAPVTQADFAAARALGRSSCALTSNGAYEVRSYTTHPNNDRFFYVDPPVSVEYPMPAVLALVRTIPAVITQASDAVPMSNTAPELYRGALKDWMLYRAFAKDVESTESFQKSQAHYKAFYQFIGTPPRDKRAVPVASSSSKESARASPTQ